MVYMVAHGLSTAALFLTAGFLMQRANGSSLISDFGGVNKAAPVLAGFFMFAALSSLALPGLVSFVGEFMVILGAVKYDFWIGALAATALILGAAYSLWLVKRVVFGEVANKEVAALQDLSMREFLMLGVLALAVIWMGIYPAPFTDAMQTSVSDLLNHVANSKLPQ